jgi:PhzF family phenazine biosynthesis protein
MKINYFHINTFSSEAFCGNPAIVCVLDDWPDDATLQKLAQEFNQCIIAFLIHNENETAIRWFTISKEMSICGHGLLAAAYVIKNHLSRPASNELIFKTIDGDISANLEGDLLSIKLPRSTLTETAAPENIIEMVG